MSSKKSIDVLIGGKVYTLCGYESEEYLQKVASYINNKIAELNTLEAVPHFSADMKAVLTSLNIADDYFKAKSQADKLEEERQAKEREIYDLKHDLISAQIRNDTHTQTIEKLEQQNKELQLQIAKLEAVIAENKEADEE